MIVYIDDILVTGPTDEEHLASLEEVLDRIESTGLRLKRRKCSFMAKSVVFLGYQIDAQGLHPEEEEEGSSCARGTRSEERVGVEVVFGSPNILFSILTKYGNGVKPSLQSVEKGSTLEVDCL